MLTVGRDRSYHGGEGVSVGEELWLWKKLESACLHLSGSAVRGRLTLMCSCCLLYSIY